MDMETVDTIMWYACRAVNFMTVNFFLNHWIWGVCVPYGKFFGGKTFMWSNFDDSKHDPGMSFALYTILMEFPVFIYTFLIFPYGKHASNPKAWILMAPYIIHYLDRAIIYPYLTNKNKVEKMYIWSLPFVFIVTFAIAVSQTRYISHFYDYDNDTWFWWRVPVGAALFFWAFWHRCRMDHYMIGLKGKHRTYVIPKGGWFELVSCPHFFAELIEWLAWFIMTKSSSFIQFYIYTLSLLIPRAYLTHKWYLKKFEEYPKNRKILIPYLF